MANVELESYSTLRNDASLLSYYRFESNLTDSKSAWNGTNSGVTYAAGKFGNAGIFNGSSYFTLPTSTSFDLTSGTWNFWVKLNSTTAGINNIFDHWDETTGSGNYAGMSISHYTDGVNKFRTEVLISDGSAGNQTTNTIDHGTSDTAYHLITVTLTGTTSVIYFDGTAVSTKTNHSSVNYSTNPVIYVGCRHREFTNSNDYFLSGEIDDMSIFSRVLSGTEISDYYNGLVSGILTTAKTLVVGGGAGGGYGRGGGGGAGAVRKQTSATLNVGANTVTVGAGGANDTDGVASSFAGVTSSGGGHGGGEPGYGSSAVGLPGGSGGGGIAPSSAGGAGTTGGNNGGTGGTTTNYNAGGGGGAGAVGVNGASNVSGNGGIGIQDSISGSAVYYGGGGGGSGNGGTPGTGGTGGGGNGTVTAGATGGAGTANTGGGGGGGAGTATRGLGGAGGSGIVIISYATDGSDGVSNTSTGGTITTSGANTIHTFTSSGTFTMVASSTVNSNFFLFF